MIRSFAEANRILATFAPPPITSGAVLILDRMRKLLAFLDNPQEKYKVIHVAGTSGKTSTTYYIASFLTESGFKVGHTVSPHIYEVNERVQINLQPLPEALFTRELEAFLKLVEASGVEPTYFELLVAFAFWEFAKRQVEYAVIEVGLGGLMDATNVINREDKVAVLTDIGLDHIEALGNTLPKIAAQKAGIIQKHNRAFSYRQGNEVMAVFREIAKRKDAVLTELPPVPASEAKDLPLYQQRNYTLAKAVYEFLRERDEIQPLRSERVQAVVQTYIPARMEVIPYEDKFVILDGAHNKQKIQALAESLKAKFGEQPIATLFSVVERKVQGKEDIKAITELSNHMILTSFHKFQDMRRGSADPAEIADYCRQNGYYDFEIIPDLEQAFQALLKRPEKVLLITGSFFLLDHLSPLIGKVKA